MVLGVNGYVDKTEPIEYVLSAVETVRSGGMFFASRVRAKGGSGAGLPMTRPTLEVPLTEREQEIAPCQPRVYLLRCAATRASRCCQRSFQSYTG